MLKFSHTTLILLSGSVWFLVGLYLLPLGIHFLVTSSQISASLPLTTLMGSFISPENTTILLVAIGLYIGYMKGRYVLSKAAQKGINRLLESPNPASLSCVYTPRYLLLLALMVGIGISLKVFNFPMDIRGLIDVAIGTALINGSIFFFRQAWLVKT